MGQVVTFCLGHVVTRYMWEKQGLETSNRVFFTQGRLSHRLGVPSESSGFFLKILLLYSEAWNMQHKNSFEFKSFNFFKNLCAQSHHGGYIFPFVPLETSKTGLSSHRPTLQLMALSTPCEKSKSRP